MGKNIPDEISIMGYWKDKSKKMSCDTESLESRNENEIRIIRKMMIMKVMDIPADALNFYLKRDPWLRDFAMEGMELKGDSDKLTDTSYFEQRDRLLELYFYKEDHLVLAELLPETTNASKPDKNMVCNRIKKLLDPKIYDRLEAKQQKIVDLYEKIYFYPVELINGYIEEKAGSETYYTILMEQWKTANEMAANISAQRNNMNNFYMSLMSVLIGGILLSDQVVSSDNIVRTIMYLIIGIIGIMCCIKWMTQIDSYGKLNGAKYEIINELERNLSANVMLCEWLRTEKSARKQKNKINFSKQEYGIAFIFLVLIILVTIVMLLGTWNVLENLQTWIK